MGKSDTKRENAETKNEERRKETQQSKAETDEQTRKTEELLRLRFVWDCTERGNAPLNQLARHRGISHSDVINSTKEHTHTHTHINI